MQEAVWQQAWSACADPERARESLRRFVSAHGEAGLWNASPEQARILAVLFSGSQALGELLIAHPDWIATALDPELLARPRRKQGLEREIQSWSKPMREARDMASAFSKLREFKQREMLRIAARDLARMAGLAEILGEISSVADVCLATAYDLCHRQLAERFGQPWHRDAEGRWQPTPFAVIGLGKLGGQELNYSSDVDVIFVYGEEGQVFKEPPRKKQDRGKGLSSHQFFLRLAEAFIVEVRRLTPQGALYRIDLRLRPEGSAGPLARSLGSYENYYAQWGQTWERLMLIKARGVAGDEALASEFLEMIQPFRYPRSLSERVLQDIAEMKQRIETEVVKVGEIDRNVKLGRGGIREIEFVVQTLQMLHAGRTPFLQDAQTLSGLQTLVRYRLLSAQEAEGLSHAYGFLRDVEHRLQMENNLQTHTIPTDPGARERLARLMGFPSWAEFEAAKVEHSREVRRAYEALLGFGRRRPARELPSLDAGDNEWRELLEAHSFREPDRAFQLLRRFVQGPGYGHVSPRTSELAWQLVQRLLALCPKRADAAGSPLSKAQSPPSKARSQPKEAGDDSSVSRASRFEVLSDPDRVLARLDSFIHAYGARAMLYETWSSNPTLFRLLLLLFDRSEFLAEIAIRTPDLVDELELSGRLRRRKTAEEVLRDLRHGLADKDQRLWLRQYHQAELMRVGLRDILGLAGFEQSLEELSALADACLQYALEAVLRKHKLKIPPFAIIGLGKLGGSELNYGSDLDLLFVADSEEKNLARRQSLAGEIMELVSSPTEMGVAFVIDVRLRPDGEKGLLVNTLAACEEYYRNRAWLWEIQALTRTRPIAGNAAVGRRFQEFVGALTNFKQPARPPAAYTPHWRAEIHKMRLRTERERTPAGQDALAIKTGAGGLMDAEFLAQTICLARGWQEPNTLRALLRAGQHQALAAADAELLIDNYRKLRRIEGILRRWSYAGESLLPDDPAPLYRVAVRCGFARAEEFMEAVGQYRAAIRSVYLKLME